MEFYIFALIFTISIIQSIAGVGILVLGTPIMLIMKFTIIETMFFLLPLSIISSFCNLILINFFSNNKPDLNLKLIKYFFIFCFPPVCVGLIIIKAYGELINFNTLVSIVIFCSIIVKISIKKSFANLKKKSKKITTLFIGLIHGLTNSGGTLLSLLILNEEKKKINISRFEIHLFYFFLAASQLIILSFLEDHDWNYQNNIIFFLATIIISSLIGNKIASVFKDLVSWIVYMLAIIASLILFIK
jgi:uncharacterized membrane protein YfcA